MLDVGIPNPGARHVEIEGHLVEVDIPILIGMDVLYVQRLVLYFSNWLLSGKHGESYMSIASNLGHLLLQCKSRNILYSKRKFRRLHFHFMHPDADRLFYLVTRSRPREAGWTEEVH